ERTQMLAAITHDLQTPLTRLRLRLENVTDEALRERLIGDLAAMQALVREGLELARSAESSEQRAALDLDSLLESIVEDTAEGGG
ncbi:histidine kinase dimerization/phospho-acceptor domain-containing protein, partial [Escherichia coli]|uniref:histidine kinase dimerization/phospho-acceptor domain-containing protein n=2 Tax=Gammaproteobacteria TaxID=1236 RepID=UPI003F26959E